MRKYLVTTASAIALILGAATAANAADPTTSDKPAATTQPMSPNSPGAGAIKRDDAMKNDPAMQERTTTETRSRSADTANFKSYEDNKAKLGSASIAGGLSAENLIGADVVNAEGDAVGEIEDLVVGADNKIETAIVEVGGFLGMGATHVSVDIAQLKPGPDGKKYTTTMTKEELKTLPTYKKENGSWMRTYK